MPGADTRIRPALPEWSLVRNGRAKERRTGGRKVACLKIRLASERLPVIGLSLQLAAALVTLLLALVGPHHPLAVFGPLLPLTFGQGLALPFITARSVTLSPNYAGIASSLLGFSQQAGAAVAVQAMGWAPTTSAVPVLIFCSCTAAVALLPLLATTRGALAQVGTRSRR